MVDLANLFGWRGVTTGACARNDPVYVHLGGPQCNEGHRNLETFLTRDCRVPKRDGSPERRLKGKVLVITDMGFDELFEFTVGDGADILWDSAIGTAVQFRGTVICVEDVGNADADRENTLDFPPPGGPATTNMRGGITDGW